MSIDVYSHLETLSKPYTALSFGKLKRPINLKDYSPAWEYKIGGESRKITRWSLWGRRTAYLELGDDFKQRKRTWVYKSRS